MTILLSMMQRHGKYIEPEDVANAVLTQGADATRAELVRLMAEVWASNSGQKYSARTAWEHLCWVCEEQARTA